MTAAGGSLLTPRPGQWFTASTDPDAVFERTAAEPVDFGGSIGKCIRAFRGELTDYNDVEPCGDSEWVALSVVDRLLDRLDARDYLKRIKRETESR